MCIISFTMLYFRTFKQECKAFIKIRLSEDKLALEVKEMMLDHNHDVNPKIFMNLPQQRKVDESVSICCMVYIISSLLILYQTRTEIEKALHWKSNKKLIQIHVVSTTGKLHILNFKSILYCNR